MIKKLFIILTAMLAATAGTEAEEMAINKENFRRVELATGIVRDSLPVVIGEGDIEADRFGVEVFRGAGDTPTDLTGMDCTGYFIRQTGDTVVITGTVDGNRAWVDLPQACYAYEGQFSLAIKLADGDVTGTMRIVDGVVLRTTTDTVVDPGTIIPSVEALIAAIEAAEESIPQEYSDLSNSVKTTGNALGNGTEKITGAKPYQFISGYYISCASGTTAIDSRKSANAGWSYALIPVTEGEKVSLRSYGISGVSRAWGIFSADGTRLDYSSLTSAVNETTLIMPEDAAYLAVNNRTEDNPVNYYAYKGEPITEVIETVRPYVEHKENLNIGSETTGTAWVFVGDGSSGTEVYRKTGLSVNYCSFDPYPVTPGQRIYVKVYQQSSTSQKPVFFVHASETEGQYVIDSKYGKSSSGEYEVTAIVPDDATHILITCKSDERRNLIVQLVTDTGLETYMNQSFRGCTFSLLGDSISAFRGAPGLHGSHYYYPNENSDVQRQSEMWWSIVARDLGMTPLVMDGWSGSYVMPGIRGTDESDIDTSTYIPGCDPARCQALHSGTTNPDVIFIALGTNDYSYMGSHHEDQLGTWNGHEALGTSTDTTLTDWDTGTFVTAYATMIARIQKKYPKAMIVCFSPWYVSRYETDLKSTYLNEIGLTETDYADAIKKVAEIMHCRYIDVLNLGFNRYNYYAEGYAIDSAAKPTHMSVKGQLAAAKFIEQELMRMERFGN